MLRWTVGKWSGTEGIFTSGMVMKEIIPTLSCSCSDWPAWQSISVSVRQELACTAYLLPSKLSLQSQASLVLAGGVLFLTKAISSV